MSEADYIDRWRFHLAGLALDAMEARTAEHREIYRRSLFAKVDAALASTWKSAIAEARAAVAAEAKLTNGASAPVRKP